ncbi:Podocan-like protein 1 [Sarracenia purpurea var. burkii]
MYRLRCVASSLEENCIRMNFKGEVEMEESNPGGFKYFIFSVRGSFDSCLSVNELYLGNNPIKSIHYSAFEKLNSLRILDLSDNQLQNLFADLPVSVEVLYLDRNPLSSEYVFQQRALKKLTVSSRVFGGRGKVDKCRNFGRFARQKNIEVKNLWCHNNKDFESSAKSFDRDYSNDDAWYEGPDEILNWNIRNPDLFDLQTLISKGLGVFFKSVLVEKKELEDGMGKIKEPIKMDDYVVKNPELALRNVFLSGFPLFKNVKEPQVTLGSADAQDMRVFKVS